MLGFNMVYIQSQSVCIGGVAFGQVPCPQDKIGVWLNKKENNLLLTTHKWKEKLVKWQFTDPNFNTFSLSFLNSFKISFQYSVKDIAAGQSKKRISKS